jgi:hypothetical protein
VESIAAWSGKNLMVMSVPSRTPITRARTTEIAEMIRVFLSPTWMM